MAVWPASLPTTLGVGMTDTQQQGFLRTEMEAGPYKQRSRYTAVSRFLSGTMLLTQAQRQTFNAFYGTTLGFGAAEFDWADPVDGTTVSMRFTDTPSFSAVAGGGTGSPGGAAALWRTTISVEVLPT